MLKYFFPQAHVRKQACFGLHRLCFGQTKKDKKVTTFLGPVLEQLLTFLTDSELFKPKKCEVSEICFLKYINFHGYYFLSK